MRLGRAIFLNDEFVEWRGALFFWLHRIATVVLAIEEGEQKGEELPVSGEI